MGTHATFQAGLLRGKAMFITGGGSGINRQIARTFAQAGAAVTIVGRTVDEARAAAAEIEASCGRAIGLSADVRNYAALRSAVERWHTVIGTIDIVVAGAAGNFVAPAISMSSNGFRAVVDTD